MATPDAAVPNRPAITACVILSTLMQALDTTIANVALPYVQGSVAASQDQIEWVLTSYIVAAAIMTPPTGILAQRFGIKRVFMVSVAGFTAASMLCGMAQSLTQIVLARVLQGMFGAALVPLAQTVMFDINPPERRGSAMALWGVAVMTGPVLGPVLGGWITASYSWRYVFYINLPIGLLALAGVSTFLSESRRDPRAKLDWVGFVALSVTVGAFQVMLDRGAQLDWFSSGEIITEAVIAGVALYVFLVRTFTTPEPFLKPSLFRDRNLAAGTFFVFVIGLTYYASLALQTPYLQTLMNYSVVTAGIVMGPRGLGTMAAMLVVGRAIGRVDTRVLLGIGLSISAWSFYVMTGWTPDVSPRTIIWVGAFQGLGLGFLFTPLSVVTLATVPVVLRTQAAGVYSLARNVGSSIGISIVNVLLIRNTQINHAEIGTHIIASNPLLGDGEIARLWSPFDAAGRAALNATITQQATVIAYVDDYKLLMIAIFFVMPLVMIFKPPKAGAAGPVVAAE